VTFDDDLRMVVSDRVRTEFNNGNEYRRLHGSRLRVPDDPAKRPNPELLRWHQSERFVA
jgi:putative restriction endonuclease